MSYIGTKIISLNRPAPLAGNSFLACTHTKYLLPRFIDSPPIPLGRPCRAQWVVSEADSRNGNTNSWTGTHLEKRISQSTSRVWNTLSLFQTFKEILKGQGFVTKASHSTATTFNLILCRKFPEILTITLNLRLPHSHQMIRMLYDRKSLDPLFNTIGYCIPSGHARQGTLRLPHEILQYAFTASQQCMNKCFATDI